MIFIDFPIYGLNDPSFPIDNFPVPVCSEDPSFYLTPAVLELMVDDRCIMILKFMIYQTSSLGHFTRNMDKYGYIMDKYGRCLTW